MVQCEMCGTETASPNRVKIEGAELDVCDECTDFGTEVKTDSGTSSTSTKYSTSSSDSSSSSSGRSSTSTGNSGGSRRSDMYDEIEELATDYDDRVRNAREHAGLSQDELAQQLNEKSSLIRKIERGDTLPTDDIQAKLERNLDIDLTTSGSSDETEWKNETSSDGYTLGDVVERNDS